MRANLFGGIFHSLCKISVVTLLICIAGSAFNRAQKYLQPGLHKESNQSRKNLALDTNIIISMLAQRTEPWKTKKLY